jgi:transaldolase
MNQLKTPRIKIFADGANLAEIRSLYNNPVIDGFTTNPSLMHKAGILDYESFAKEMLTIVPDRPISFEVFADDFQEMGRQAREIASWGKNVYVKIPITNTVGLKSQELIQELSQSGVNVNVTAVMTLKQVKESFKSLEGGAPAYISIFAGRIADTGRDPLQIVRPAVQLSRLYKNVEIIWASPREILNLFQADGVGCHIITVTNDILKKLELRGKPLSEYSLETVKMFRNDAVASRYIL